MSIKGSRVDRAATTRDWSGLHRRKGVVWCSDLLWPTSWSASCRAVEFTSIFHWFSDASYKLFGNQVQDWPLVHSPIVGGHTPSLSRIAAPSHSGGCPTPFPRNSTTILSASKFPFRQRTGATFPWCVNVNTLFPTLIAGERTMREAIDNCSWKSSFSSEYSLLHKQLSPCLFIYIRDYSTSGDKKSLHTRSISTYCRTCILLV